MEKGDIASYQRPERACLFEGLLASPPTKVRRFFNRDKESPEGLKGWTAHELPLKSLIDSTNRLNIHTQVVTLMGSDMEDPIYYWLLRKGVSCIVHGYDSVEQLAEDIKYNRGLSEILVPDTDMSHRLGIRAKVVSPATAWSN